MLKHEASLLIQIHTEKIGLRAFLFTRRVPDIPTPRCRCGAAWETAEHIILHCDELREERETLRRALTPLPLRTCRDLATVSDTPGAARELVRWLLRTDKFPMFGLAKRIGEEEGEEVEDIRCYDPG